MAAVLTFITIAGRLATDGTTLESIPTSVSIGRVRVAVLVILRYHTPVDEMVSMGRVATIDERFPVLKVDAMVSIGKCDARVDTDPESRLADIVNLGSAFAKIVVPPSILAAEIVNIGSVMAAV
jgi:hypothetical protein